MRLLYVCAVELGALEVAARDAELAADQVREVGVVERAVRQFARVGGESGEGTAVERAADEYPTSVAS